MSKFRTDRFYVSSDGWPDGGVIVCGDCAEANSRHEGIYSELDPLPQKAIEQGATRECLVCDSSVQTVEPDTGGQPNSNQDENV